MTVPSDWLLRRAEWLAMHDAAQKPHSFESGSAEYPMSVAEQAEPVLTEWWPLEMQ